MTQRRIAIDTKNLALYSGGIAGFVRPLLLSWIAARPTIRLVLIGPTFNTESLTRTPNCEHHIVPWPESLPRSLRHPFYDNVMFPQAIRRMRPDFVFSPYHDVRLPVGIPSVMMIHDTCLGDFPGIYPWRVRAYFQAMLRVNLKRASHVLTVSEASRACILARHRLDPQRISVVPNTLEPEFFTANEHTEQPVEEIRAQRPGGLHLFYPSGAEFRKNVKRLLDALNILLARGIDVHLWATGLRDAGWDRALIGASPGLLSRVQFLGKLSLSELRHHYLAADTVVYPSLCEGFGRVCLEAMEIGAPIACSDLPPLREVAGGYPIYFDPMNTEQMAESILTSASQGRKEPRHEPRFQREAVTNLFLETMDRILATELGHA